MKLFELAQMKEVETMDKQAATNITSSMEIASDSKTIINKYYSVQFFLNDTGLTYLFKLRNTSENGLCILAKKESIISEKLKVGDILDMEYNPMGSSDLLILKTLINSKNSHDCVSGHSLIGLSILDERHEHLWTLGNHGMKNYASYGSHTFSDGDKVEDEADELAKSWGFEGEKKAYDEYFQKLYEQ